jgi:23S rRNA (guanosine2251-2'-O)-methyltransferase
MAPPSFRNVETQYDTDYTTEYGPNKAFRAGAGVFFERVAGDPGDGEGRLTQETCDHLVKIPISDKVESLNVAATAAIALYELAKPYK